MIWGYYYFRKHPYIYIYMCFWTSIPIPSHGTGIFTYINSWIFYGFHVCKYTIHGSYGDIGIIIYNPRIYNDRRYMAHHQSNHQTPRFFFGSFEWHVAALRRLPPRCHRPFVSTLGFFSGPIGSMYGIFTYIYHRNQKRYIYIYHTLDPMGDMFRGALNEVVPSFFSGKLEVVPCFYRVEYGKFRISLNIRVALEQQKLVHLVQLSFKTMIHVKWTALFWKIGSFLVGGFNPVEKY